MGEQGAFVKLTEGQASFRLACVGARLGLAHGAQQVSDLPHLAGDGCEQVGVLAVVNADIHQAYVPSSIGEAFVDAGHLRNLGAEVD